MENTYYIVPKRGANLARAANINQHEASKRKSILPSQAGRTLNDYSENSSAF